MDTEKHFPFFHSVIRTFTGRWAQRIYIAILTVTLFLTASARLRSYFLAQKIQAVLRGLEEIRIDQTTEEQLLKTVPYLTRSANEWKHGGTVQRPYHVEISNEADARFLGLMPHGFGRTSRWAQWLGYRYISFDAGVLLQDGKVTHVEYGLANHWERPQYAGYTGYIVSARSVHGFWLPRLTRFGVSSQDDHSPQYRPSGGKNGLYVIFTNDAPSKHTERAFHLNLSCFWSLRGCNDAREIAPALWQDAQTIQAATYQQLISEKCPDSIIEGRMRYLPDISVSLLEVTGSRRIEVNEEGDKTEDWFTDYKLKEVIRGKSFGPLNNIRFRQRIPSPTDPTREIANQIWPPTKIGSEVLYFGTLSFSSCRIIPATAPALEIVRGSPIPVKRPEDEIPVGLQ